MIIGGLLSIICSAGLTFQELNCKREYENGDNGIRKPG